jgi:rod shape-determining protein MreC
MESVLGRYRNLIILVGVLFAQMLGLAVQVKRTTDTESTRLIRVWTVSAVTPFEKGLVWIRTSTYNIWHNYAYLRGVRQENRDLKAEIERLRIEQVRLKEDADQARRLQALLSFKEEFISKTLPAQVIGTTGSELSRAVYIDKGSRDGLEHDMPVITADGVVGKVLQVFKSTSLVLLLNDQTSGVGAILEKSRVQGVVKGTATGEVFLDRILNDQQVEPGEKVLTAGGDRIFPKGLALGTVTKVTPGQDVFLNIRVKPAVNPSRLEEVLVITKREEKQAVADESVPVRAADVLAQRLPGVPEKPAAADPNKSQDKAKAATEAVTGTSNPAGNSPAASQSKPPAPKPNASDGNVPRAEGVAATPTSGTPAIKPAASSGQGAKIVQDAPKPAKPSATTPTGNPPQ